MSRSEDPDGLLGHKVVAVELPFLVLDDGRRLLVRDVHFNEDDTGLELSRPPAAPDFWSSSLDRRFIMASGAQVTLRGRFSPGTVVRLVRVASEATLRAEGGEEVATKKVDSDGEVQFKTGVEVGARYFIVGQQDGFHLEVRARGRAADDVDPALAQAPVARDRGFFAGILDGDGNRLAVDAEPPRVELPRHEAAPNLSQQQIDSRTPQRSATPVGTAHPFDPSEQAPYPDQESLPKGAQQMSDTRSAGGGMATPVDVGPQRQEDVPKGTPQRSATPTGVATVIPSPPVEAQIEKESSEGKAKRGQPTRVSAEPLGGGKVTGASQRKSEKHEEKVREQTREALASPPATDVLGDENTSGLDATGQPVSEDVGRAAGVEPASKPAEPVGRRSLRRSKRS